MTHTSGTIMISGKTSPRIVFFGNERLVSGLSHTDAPVLKGLLKEEYDVAAIVSHHTESRSRSARPLEVANIAKEHDIPLFLPAKPMEIYDTLVGLQADAAVLVAYGRIIPQKIIDIFPKGIINVHPSLLPKYRGPTPIETPIAQNDTETGVSIMQLTSGMDEGPVYAQETITLTSHDTKFSVYESLVAKSTELLLQALPRILDGSLQPKDQDDEKATYSQLLTKKDAFINPSVLTATQADAHVRAYLGFPGTRLTVGSVEVILTKTHVSDLATDLSMECVDGKFLAIDILKPLGKKEMPVEAFLAGYKSRL
jgi:methionyl-tRNA formyltransferase